jgi:predicted RNase H-like HicB family nuclease
MNIEYTVQISWSTEDGAYIAMPAELPGCMADGQTQEEALANLKVIIEEWIAVAKEQNRKIPEPMSVQDLARFQEHAMAEQQERVHQYIRQEVEKAVTEVVQKFVQQQAVSGWASFPGRTFFKDPDELVTAGEHHNR